MISGVSNRMLTDLQGWFDRVDQFYLVQQPWHAYLRFGRSGDAVISRPALNYIADIHMLFPGETANFKYPVKQLTRFADKGSALQIFIVAGGLSEYEHCCCPHQI